MVVKSASRINEKHIGQNVKRLRMYLGVKQEALAADLGISQTGIVKIEKQNRIEEELLDQIANALNLSVHLIKDFDVGRALDNINSTDDTTTMITMTVPVSDIQSKQGIKIPVQFNPLDKIVELYERLLKSEKEKIELLMNR